MASGSRHFPLTHRCLFRYINIIYVTSFYKVFSTNPRHHCCYIHTSPNFVFSMQLFYCCTMSSLTPQSEILVDQWCELRVHGRYVFISAWGQSPWLYWLIGSYFLQYDESLLSCWFLAPPTTTVNPSISTESTRTSTTETPRTANTATPTGNTTTPERDSTTIVITNPHMTTGASTSALPMPTPTKDPEPGKQLCFWAQKPLKDWI